MELPPEIWRSTSQAPSQTHLSANSAGPAALAGASRSVLGPSISGRRRNEHLRLEPACVRSNSSAAVETTSPQISGDIPCSAPKRRSFLFIDDDEESDQPASNPVLMRSEPGLHGQSHMRSIDEDDLDPTFLTARRPSIADSASSPTSVITLGAASVSTPASPVSPTWLRDDQNKTATLCPQPSERTKPSPSALRLSPSIQSLRETNPRNSSESSLHSPSAPLARRPSATLSTSTRSQSLSGDSMSSPYATPALTHGSSVFSRPGSSAFTSDTDVSNRVSVASCTRSSVDSPVVDTSTENKSKGLHQPHSASLSNASAIEVLSVDPNQHAAHEWSMPSPNGIGVGLTTEEDDDDNEQPGPLLRQESYNSLSNSGMWSAGGRQRSIAPSGSRSRSSSVAERIERARLSSATSSLADHTRSQLQGAVTPVHRVAGLQGASSDTTSWSLRGLPAEQVTIALDNMVSMTSLTSLDLSHCGLGELPLAISSLTALKTLDLTGNQLQRKTPPPWLASLTSLEKLVLDCCDLYSLYHPLSTLSSLHTLSLQDNKLKSLPAWLCHLEHLKELHIDGNPLHGIFADLARPLLRRASFSASQRVGSMTSLTNSLFDSQPISRAVSRAGSRAVSPSPADVSQVSSNSLLDFVAGPIEPRPPLKATASPLFGSFRSAPANDSASSARDRSWTAPHVHDRPLTSHWHHEEPNTRQGQLKKMKSSGDVRGGQSPSLLQLSNPDSEKRRSACADLPSPRLPQTSSPDPSSPSLSSMISPPLPTPPNEGESPPSVRKKKSSFFKKMSSFGRSRKESTKRPSISESLNISNSPPDDVPPPLPEKASRLEPALPRERERTDSTATQAPAAIATNLRPASAASFASSSRTQLKLDQMPPVPSSGAVVALNEGDSDAEEIFDDSLASSKVESAREGQHGAGLQALLAYLKDLDDLAPRSGGPLGPALARPGGFRREKTPRSFVSSAHEGYQADTDTTKATQASFDSPADSPQLPIFKLKEDLAKRESVLNEIVATERSYVMGLQELVEVYVKPSSRPAKPTSSGVGSSSSRDTIIPTAERKAVFSNVENLLQFHESAFLPDLESVLARLSGNQRESDASGTEQHSALLTSTAEEIAKVFVRHGAFLRMYHIYVNNFDAALARCKSWTASTSSSGAGVLGSTKLASSSSSSKEATSAAGETTLSTSQRKRIKAFLKQCRLDPRHSQMNCESYLLMPIQRIPRYRMLLESLVSCTPVAFNTGSPHANPVLTAALELATNLATDLNEKKRESEGRSRLLHWQGRIGNRFKSPLVQPHRLLLRESKMTLSRVVKRSTDIATAQGNSANGISTSMFQVESLKIEEEQGRPLVALLSTDILVLVFDNGSDAGQVELFTVIRLVRPTHYQCASACGKEGKTLRIVDPQRAIMYLEAPSSTDAQEWASAINQQAAAF